MDDFFKIRTYLKLELPNAQIMHISVNKSYYEK